MNICDSLKEKTIIIAEQKQDSEHAIKTILQKQGMHNFEFASDVEVIQETLHACYRQPSTIGLVIINEDLLNRPVKEICKTLSCHELGIFIPLLILRNRRGNNFINHNQGLVYKLDWSYKASDLLMAIDFLLMMKHERCLRYQQEERLINELATNIVNDNQQQYSLSHDQLTGLANRQHLEGYLNQFLDREDTQLAAVTLLCIDIDRFSLINELEGFAAGEQLVVEAAALISNSFNEDLLFVRMGADEFCLVVENKSDAEVHNIAEKIRTELQDYRFISGGTLYSITASIGIATFDPSRSALSHPEELISRSQKACYLAKENGRNMIWKYNEQEKDIKQRHLDVYWMPLIKEALSENKFFLVFQPVVNLDDGVVSHYEVLVRMRGKQGETINPGEFILVAERMGLIHSIDLWVVGSAIDFLASLPRELSAISLAINLSSVAFQDSSLLPMIKQKLLSTGIKANRITFEITETAAVENYQQTRDMIINIRELGCHFALDDFGAGFCSFNYLKNFPVDYIKIDGQFIQNLTHDETDQVLVKSMTEIAKKLGKRTIAEFVENPRAIALLKEMGVNLGQGYIFGRPHDKLLATNSVSISDLLSRNC